MKDENLKDIINNDVSRCNDYKCPTNAFCARFRQLRYDKQNGIKPITVINFKGVEKTGLCEYFINADINN